MRMIFSLLLVVVLGMTAFWLQTDGFSVVTTEAARRANVIKQPVSIPDTVLLTSANDHVNLLENLQKDGRLAVVNFMYTRCPSICTTMGAEFQRLQAQLQEHGLQDQIRLISISFDAADRPKWLARYQQQMGADAGIWQVVLARDDVQRRTLLDTFGIVVVPASLGQYEHNGAYHIVTPDGRLERIIDLEEPSSVLRYAQIHAARHAASVGGERDQAS